MAEIESICELDSGIYQPDGDGLRCRELELVEPIMGTSFSAAGELVQLVGDGLECFLLKSAGLPNPKFRGGQSIDLRAPAGCDPPGFLAILRRMTAFSYAVLTSLRLLKNSDEVRVLMSAVGNSGHLSFAAGRRRSGFTDGVESGAWIMRLWLPAVAL